MPRIPRRLRLGRLRFNCRRHGGRARKDLTQSAVEVDGTAVKAARTGIGLEAFAKCRPLRCVGRAVQHRADQSRRERGEEFHGALRGLAPAPQALGMRLADVREGLDAVKARRKPRFE